MQLSVSSESKGLDVAELQRQLKTQIIGIGDKLLYLPTVDSTNSLAMKLANERSEEGVVVLTDNQTAGKGRLGRRWVDVAGCNVLSSTLLRPHFPPHFLIMVASLAIVDAIIETCAITANIKWPNDVLIGDRKVAGILIETSHIQCGTAERDRASQLVAILVLASMSTGISRICLLKKLSLMMGNHWKNHFNNRVTHIGHRCIQQRQHWKRNVDME